MAPSTPGPSSDGRTPSGQPSISAGGSYTLDSVAVGNKLFVQKPLASGQLEERKAEILSARDAKTSIYGRRQQQAAAAMTGAGTTEAETSLKEYYVHYVEFNKRLDEWVPSSRLVLTREMEWPAPPVLRGRKPSDSPGPNAPSPSRAPSLLKKATKASSLSQMSKNSKANKTTAAAATGGSTSTSTPTSTPASTDGKKRKLGESPGLAGSGSTSADGNDEDGEGEVEEVASPAESVLAEGSLSAPLNGQTGPEVFSKEQEIEKLRTSGSMTQSHGEVSRVKNLNKLQIGKHEVEAWYFSPYPSEFAHLPVLYICEMCLSFWPSPLMLSRHRTKCGLYHPPGNEIYRHEDISFYEIDGKKQKTWCRNLCLLSKCFLDHKTLYYDVDPFLYYCMAVRDDTGCHLIGYFSKEKESADGYNVACILTLPQHQRHGFGKLLIEFSYELSKIEGKLGSPEKPLSDLGLLSYRAYWAETIIELLLQTEGEISIDEIASKTALTHADVMHTCQAYSMLRFYKGSHLIVLTEGVLDTFNKARKKTRRRIVPEKLQWKPPVYSRSELRFGW
ncbi:histone acetyltransferase esa1 [Phaffia rhodozyma]|uniref:Histone acetyltransferase ESA1 n=1 Tax=Phaffia rhodozyma TaxID=264483 RepID=A0A0F7SKU6_PHARH|nr:histone acetyltransferase esa1 [Phaffia rhodozyma]